MEEEIRRRYIIQRNNSERRKKKLIIVYQKKAKIIEDYNNMKQEKTNVNVIKQKQMNDKNRIFGRRNDNKKEKRIIISIVWKNKLIKEEQRTVKKIRLNKPTIYE